MNDKHTKIENNRSQFNVMLTQEQHDFIKDKAEDEQRHKKRWFTRLVGLAYPEFNDLDPEFKGDYR